MSFHAKRQYFKLKPVFLGPKSQTVSQMGNETTIQRLEETLTNQVLSCEELYFMVFLGNCQNDKVTAGGRSGIFRLTHRNGKLGHLMVELQSRSID